MTVKSVVAGEGNDAAMRKVIEEADTSGVVMNVNLKTASHEDPQNFSLTPQEALDLVENQGITIIIDLRREEHSREIRPDMPPLTQNIVHFRNIPVEAFPREQKGMVVEKFISKFSLCKIYDKYLVFGEQEPDQQLVNAMREYGFEVYTLKGGFQAWQAAGLGIDDKNVLDFGLQPEESRRILENGEVDVLIDARTIEEYKEKRLPFPHEDFGTFQISQLRKELDQEGLGADDVMNALIKKGWAEKDGTQFKIIIDLNTIPDADFEEVLGKQYIEVLPVLMQNYTLIRAHDQEVSHSHKLGHLDLDGKYFVCCASGVRAYMIKEFLELYLEIEGVRMLRGGLLLWQSDKFPVWINGQVYVEERIDAASLTSKIKEDIGGIDMNDINIDFKGENKFIYFNMGVTESLMDRSFDRFTPIIVDFSLVDSILPFLGVQ